MLTHTGREKYYFIVDHPPPDLDTSPHSKFAWTKTQLSELMRWAVEAIQVYDRVNRDHFDHQRMYKAGLSDERMWASGRSRWGDGRERRVKRGGGSTK